MRKENPKNKPPFVAYYRVSTKKQSKEMPAQRRAVKNYLKQFWPPTKSFIEIESGGKSDRVELKKALEYCKEHNATLVVAKLDRLSRDLEFIGWLQKTDIKFVCCDMPQATRETIGFMGVMARWEREQIAKRTKEALAEKREQGVKLGAHNPKVRAGLKKFRKEQAIETAKKRQAQKAEREKAKALKAQGKIQAVIKPTKRELADQQILPTIKALRGQGLSYKATAQAMNRAGIRTRQGSDWNDTQVFIVCKRNGL